MLNLQKFGGLFAAPFIADVIWRVYIRRAKNRGRMVEKVSGNTVVWVAICMRWVLGELVTGIHQVKNPIKIDHRGERASTSIGCHTARC
jgi:hypothetical protein